MSHLQLHPTRARMQKYKKTQTAEEWKYDSVHLCAVIQHEHSIEQIKVVEVVEWNLKEIYINKVFHSFSSFFISFYL